jgi:hypothetical protein
VRPASALRDGRVQGAPGSRSPRSTFPKFEARQATIRDEEAVVGDRIELAMQTETRAGKLTLVREHRR